MRNQRPLRNDRNSKARNRAVAYAYEEAHASYSDSGLLGSFWRMVACRPLDAFMLLVAAVMMTAIVINALALQKDRHPSPMFGSAPEATPAATPQSAALAVPSATPQVAPAAPTISQVVLPEAAQRQLLIKNIQAELIRHGMYDGVADGIFGAKTDAAIRLFEAMQGLDVTGQPTPRLLSALRGTSTSAAPPVSMPENATGHVMAVQRVLAEQGFGPIKIDGVFSDGTRDAIRRFEASRNMPQRGELSPEIIRELSSLSGVPLE